MKKIFDFSEKFQKSILTAAIAIIALQVIQYISLYIRISSTVSFHKYLQLSVANFGLYLPVVFFVFSYILIRNKKSSVLTNIFNSSIWVLFGLSICSVISYAMSYLFPTIYISNYEIFGLSPYLVINLVASIFVFSLFLGKYLKTKSDKEIKKFSKIFKTVFTICSFVMIIFALPELYISDSGNVLPAISYLIAIITILVPGYIILKGKMDNLSILFTISIGMFYAIMLFTFIQGITYSIGLTGTTNYMFLVINLVITISWFNLTMKFATLAR